VVSLTCFTLRGTITIYPFPLHSLADLIHVLQLRQLPSKHFLPSAIRKPDS
jgi:hypothetical protein